MSKLYLRQMEVGDAENFIYLIGDSEKKECVMVDPAWAVGHVLETAKQEGMKVVGALLTHTHDDHCNGLPELYEKNPCPVYVHEKEGFLIDGFPGKKILTQEGFKLKIGGIEILFLHTPGHTPGSQCFLTEGHLFSGDTLFVNACGRCDLPGGSAEQLFSSLKRLAALPDDTQVYPGHNYDDVPISTIADEKMSNPYLKESTWLGFHQLRMGTRLA